MGQRSLVERVWKPGMAWTGELKNAQDQGILTGQLFGLLDTNRRIRSEPDGKIGSTSDKISIDSPGEIL